MSEQRYPKSTENYDPEEHLKISESYCKESVGKIHIALKKLSTCQETSQLDETYTAIENATKNFLIFQNIARKSGNPNTIGTLIKTLLAECVLIETDVVFRKVTKTLSLNDIADEISRLTFIVNALSGHSVLAEQALAREKILQNFRYSITTATKESDENLKGLRTLMEPSVTTSTPAENKTQPSASSSILTSTPVDRSQKSADPKPLTASTPEEKVTPKEADAKEKESIKTAHKQALELLAKIETPDAKDEAAKVEKAITLATACADAYKALAEAPFTKPELPIDVVNNRAHNVINNVVDLQLLVRTIENKDLGRLLLNAATTQNKELETIKQYIKQRNNSHFNDADYEFIPYKLTYATDDNLDATLYKSALERIESQRKDKITQLFRPCNNWLDFLKKIPEFKPEFTIDDIHTNIRLVIKDFTALRQELTKLKDRDHAAYIVEKLKNIDISDFISYTKARNEKLHNGQEDPKNLIANLLYLKNTSVELFDFKAILPEETASVSDKMKQTIEIHSKIKSEQKELINKLKQSEPILTETIIVLRSIIAKTTGLMLLAAHKDKLTNSEKEQANMFLSELQQTNSSTLKSLLSEKFPDKPNLQEALMENNIDKLSNAKEPEKSKTSSPSRDRTSSASHPGDSPEKINGGRKSIIDIMISRKSTSSSPAKADDKSINTSTNPGDPSEAANGGRQSFMGNILSRMSTSSSPTKAKDKLLSNAPNTTLFGKPNPADNKRVSSPPKPTGTPSEGVSDPPVIDPAVTGEVDQQESCLSLTSTVTTNRSVSDPSVIDPVVTSQDESRLDELMRDTAKSINL